LYIAATGGGNIGEANIAELQLRTVVGGANAAVGGTAIRSSDWNSSWLAANAFDGNPATSWSSTGSATSGPHWIGYDFGAGQARSVAEIVITARNDSWATSLSPKSMSLQCSDNGVEWITAGAFPDQVGWVAGETRAYKI
jgi:hypothetical protein